MTPNSLTRSLERDLRRTTYSFRQLDEPEAMSLKPQRISIIKVGLRDTVLSLAQRMPFEDLKLERFRLLNGLATNERLTAGRWLKIVVD